MDSNKKYVIGVDQGTTSTKAVLLDQAGNRLALSRSEKHTFYYPQDGFVEQDALQIYEATCGVIRDVMAQVGATADDVACISFSVQTSPLVFWNKETGLPVYNMIGWQCTRGREIAQAIDPQLREYIHRQTGFPVEGASDSAKVLWLFEHVEGLRDQVARKEVLWGTIQSYLIWRLTGGASYGMEVGSANSSGLCDGETLDWADDLILSTFGLTRDMMPPITFSDERFGNATVQGLEGILLCSAMWDGFAALYSHRSYEMGDAKCSYGTGAHVAIDVGDQDGQTEKSRKIGAAFDGKAHRLLHGNVLYSGATMQWLVESLGMLDNLRDAQDIALSIDSCNGVYLVPAFSGIAAPYFDSGARACVVGMTRATTKAHIVRAGLESTAYQIKDIMDTIEKTKNHFPKKLFADGGASNNAFLMQFQADLLGFDVVCEDIEEASAVGAAYFGGLHIGFYTDLQSLTDLGENKVVYHPQITQQERDELFAGWKRAVSCVLTTA